MSLVGVGNLQTLLGVFVGVVSGGGGGGLGLGLKLGLELGLGLGPLGAGCV